jgi:hypothetical protein
MNYDKYVTKVTKEEMVTIKEAINSNRWSINLGPEYIAKNGQGQFTGNVRLTMNTSADTIRYDRLNSEIKKDLLVLLKDLRKQLRNVGYTAGIVVVTDEDNRKYILTKEKSWNYQLGFGPREGTEWYSMPVTTCNIELNIDYITSMSTTETHMIRLDSVINELEEGVEAA